LRKLCTTVNCLYYSYYKVLHKMFSHDDLMIELLHNVIAYTLRSNIFLPGEKIEDA